MLKFNFFYKSIFIILLIVLSCYLANKFSLTSGIFKFFNIVLGVFFTGILGSYLTNKVTFIFQKRANLNKIKVKKAEENIKTILDLSVRIHKSSSSRRFAMINLINKLADSNSKDLDEIRKEYRNEVKNWNTSLGSYNIELNILGFFKLAAGMLEDNIHKNFVMAHDCLNSVIKEKDKYSPRKLEKANKYLDNVFKETNKICAELIKESNRIWDELENDKSVPMSSDNLHRAKTWQLFFAIFYNPRSNPLRVRSSNSD